MSKEDSERPKRSFGRIISHPLAWVIFIGLAMGLPILRSVTSELPPPLPVVGRVPAFELVSQEGKKFGSQRLLGRAWVGHLFFTRCTGTCTDAVEAMIHVRHHTRNLGGALHLVSISGDVEYDRPAKLRGYATKQRRSPLTWTFAVGDVKALTAALATALARQGGNPLTPGERRALERGSHLFLVDRRGRIRRFYRSRRKEEISALLHEVGLMINRDD